MREYRLERELWLPRQRDEIFPFFADAHNLEQITPPWLRFRVVTPAPIAMREGALIEYRLRLHGLPIRWKTEIAVWEPPHRFVDQQLRGPYRLWHHTHAFEERDGGTLCTDVVRYAHWGGSLLQRLFVRREVESVFDYRQREMLARFGAPQVLSA